MLRTGNPEHEQPYLYGVQSPLLYTDPLGLLSPASLATVGGGCAAADGPLPIGDVIAAPLVAAAAVWWATEVITDWWDNAKNCTECKPDPCDAQYAADSERCRRLSNSRLRATCWENAAERYAACIAGRPIPRPFP